jgi:hypothetical protein
MDFVGLEADFGCLMEQVAVFIACLSLRIMDHKASWRSVHAGSEYSRSQKWQSEHAAF